MKKYGMPASREAFWGRSVITKMLEEQHQLK